jgi:hypothetical protein
MQRIAVIRDGGALPPPLAGEGWGGGELAQVIVCAPSLSLPASGGGDDAARTSMEVARVEMGL